MRGALRAGAAAVALAAAVTGCREAQNSGNEAGVPERDLTLESSATSTVQVASPIELARAPVQAAHALRPIRVTATRRSARPRSKPLPVTEPAPAPVAAPVTPAPTPAAEATEPLAGAGLGRELAPGRTVTVIPASTGSTPEPTDLPDLPARAEGRGIFVGGGSGMGGGCRGGRPEGLTGLRLRRSPG